MKYGEMRNAIEELMVAYAPGVRFEWDNATSRFGACHFRRDISGRKIPYKITISYPLASRNSWKVVKDVVIHEIAHARTPGHHHDAVWRMECLALGGDGKRCYTSDVDGGNVVSIPKKYVGVCPVCGQKFYRNRRSSGSYHCNRSNPIIWKMNTIKEN